MFVCLIPYYIKRKQIIFSWTEKSDPKVSSYCRHMHVTYLLMLSFVLLYFVSFRGLKKSLQLFFSGFSLSILLLTLHLKKKTLKNILGQRQVEL